MSGYSCRSWLLAAGLSLLVPLAGCVVVTDLMNPGVLSAVGLDPATVIRPQGRIIIAFQNSTQFPLPFVSAFTGPTVPSAATTAEELAEEIVLVSATNVDVNETRTMVVDCPVGVVLPSQAFVLRAADVVEVNYAGSLLIAGEDFVCGDVIQVSVVQVGDADGQEAFEIRVQKLPGR